MSIGMATGAKKKSWQSRDCPDDFEVIFVELGRLECEAHYRARRTTITRWLEERGKKKLLRQRADFVKYQRQLKRGKGKANGAADPQCKRKVDPKLVEIASRFLQSPKGGGWVVYAINGSAWMVGTHRRSPAEVIEIAERMGFDKRRAVEQIRAFDEPI